MASIFALAWDLCTLFCDTNVHNALIKSFVNIVVDEERTLYGNFPYMYFRDSLAINAVLQIQLR